jgi:hypothetical protein
MKQLIISSVAQMAKLLDNHPRLLDISGLTPLRGLAHSLNNPKKSCGTCQGRHSGINSFANARPQIESALANLTVEDWRSIRVILGMDKVCWFQKLNGKLTQLCVE